MHDHPLVTKPRFREKINMYTVDQHDTVTELENVPQSCVGAPCPMLWAGEDHLHLAFYLQNQPTDWDGKTIRTIDEQSSDEAVALVEFKESYAHMFGPPNDEVFLGHPLASRGLRPYGVWEVRNSSWIRQLVKMNSIHPSHRPESFNSYKHYIFTFHDTTFECAAEGFSVTIHTGSVRAVLQTAFQGMA